VISLLVRLPVVALLALSLAWAGVLALAPSPEAILKGAFEDLRVAFPDERERGVLERGAQGMSLSLVSRASVLGEDRSRLLEAALVSAALHLEGTLRVFPVGMVLALAGVAAGLVFRERLRDGEGYASPTAAGLARWALGGGMLLLATFSLSPVPAPWGSIYLAFGILSLGGGAYVANLPLRI
jgi:hypothetical protein